MFSFQHSESGSLASPAPVWAARLPEPEDRSGRVGGHRHPAHVHHVHRLHQQLAAGRPDPGRPSRPRCRPRYRSSSWPARPRRPGPARSRPPACRPSGTWRSRRPPAGRAGCPSRTGFRRTPWPRRYLSTPRSIQHGVPLGQGASRVTNSPSRSPGRRRAGDASCNNRAGSVYLARPGGPAKDDLPAVSVRQR